MINYQEFLNYLRELILLFKRQGSLRRKKDLAEKFHCVDISKDLFYQKGLHMMDPDSLTLEFAKQLRDEMSEAKKKANPSKARGTRRRETCEVQSWSGYHQRQRHFLDRLYRRRPPLYFLRSDAGAYQQGVYLPDT